MRGYECYASVLVDGVLRQCGCTACWALVNRAYWLDEKGSYTPSRQLTNEDIYIFQFRDPATERHLSLLVGIINEMTSCALVTVGDREYLRFRTLHHYEASLVLLNFIRNLWHEPVTCKGYADRFFDFLGRSHEVYGDPLQRLTWANREACPEELPYSPGHSPCHARRWCQVRHSDDLKTLTTSATTFLTDQAATTLWYGRF